MRGPDGRNGFVPEGLSDFGHKKATLYARTRLKVGMLLMVQKHEKSPFLADVRQPPEGQCDRSLARSAWDIGHPKEPPRRVRSDSCRCAHFDSVIE